MSEFIRDKAASDEAQQRQAHAYMFKQDSTGLASDGVLTGLAVTQTGTASASVIIGAGSGIVQDTVGNGANQFVVNTPLTLDVLTANPMGGTPRNDIVVFDSATHSTTTDSGGLRVIVGTPNAVPTDPTVPTTATPLARLRHAASATTVPTAKIDSLIVATALFGIPLAGAWTAVPALEAGVSTDGTSPAQYRVWSDGKVELRGRLNAGTTFAGSGVQIATLPVGARPNVARYFSTGHSFATANTADSRVTVNADGTLWLYTMASQTTWFGLDGIYYYTS